jgi:intein-encoded DNA endonuclease-like protein
VKPLKLTKTDWSAELAYCIGLIASDGNLSKDGRHIIFVSKDLEQIETFKSCLKLNNKITTCTSTLNPTGRHYRVQFGDVNFYKFLLSIGLTPAKSKTIGALTIPTQYIPDFLRGSFDGDGTFYSYFDKRWRSSHMYYLCFISASIDRLYWIRGYLLVTLGVNGYLNITINRGAYQLRYAKKETKRIIDLIYYDPSIPRLERKYKKVYNALAIDELNNSARVL